MVSTRRLPATRIGIAERIPPWIRYALCAIGTLAVLAAVSPPLLHAQEVVAMAPTAPEDGPPAVAVHEPEADLPPRSVDLVDAPTAVEHGPFTLRDFSVGYTAGPVTLGLAEVGPEMADCADETTAPAFGRVAGGRACAQPIRAKMAWW